MSKIIEYVADESVNKHPFTIIYNELIDSTLPLDTIGMLAYMCRQLPGWIFHEHVLLERFQCGDEKLQRMRREAREAGFMKLEKIPSGKGDGKYKGSRYLFSSRPIYKLTENRVSRGSVEPGVGQPAPHSTNTERNNNTERKQQHTRASLNTFPPASTKDFVAAVVENEKSKGKGEFEYVPESEDLVNQLGQIDISNQRATHLIAKYGILRIKEVVALTQTKAKTNPAAYFERALAEGWKASRTPTCLKGAPGDGPRLTTALVETEKRLEAIKAQESVKSSASAIEGNLAFMEMMQKMKLSRKPQSQLRMS